MKDEGDVKSIQSMRKAHPKSPSRNRPKSAINVEITPTRLKSMTPHTKEFRFSGRNYSKRRNVVVVENNASKKETITLKKSGLLINSHMLRTPNPQAHAYMKSIEGYYCNTDTNSQCGNSFSRKSLCSNISQQKNLLNFNTFTKQSNGSRETFGTPYYNVAYGMKTPEPPTPLFNQNPASPLLNNGNTFNQKAHNIHAQIDYFQEQLATQIPTKSLLHLRSTPYKILQRKQAHKLRFLSMCVFFNIFCF